ncbi:MAG: AmmeMemoRadiSam system protein B [Candidatus Saliniplasma sp.]
MMVRKPAVAGQFYPGSKKSLMQKIKGCFLHDLGPGKIPEDEGKLHNIKGIVAPHAGYEYSGPVAAHAYKEVYEDGKPDLFIIMGPNHRGIGASVSVTDQNFETPLGTATVDKEVIDQLVGGVIELNTTAHMGEHSLEVQLPFLQYLWDDIEMVPISFNIQDYRTAKEVGRKIKEIAGDKETLIIASTDFSHYVLKETAEKKDKMAIDKIINNDPKGLFNTIQKENISMCGYGPVMAMMMGSGGTKGRLLKYATSGDIMAMREVVGYASLTFE